jgi:hypothetical protein
MEFTNAPELTQFPDGDIARFGLHAECVFGADGVCSAAGMCASAHPRMLRAWPGVGPCFGDIKTRGDGKIWTDEKGVEWVLPPTVEAGWSGVSLYSSEAALRIHYNGDAPLYAAATQIILQRQPPLQLLQQPGAPAHFGLSPRLPMPLTEFASRLKDIATLFPKLEVAPQQNNATGPAAVKLRLTATGRKEASA